MSARNVCFYCGSTWEIQTDHVVPQCYNGRGEVPACRRCNQSKHGQTPAEWLDRISTSNRAKDQYRWRKIREWNRGRKNRFARLVHNRE